MRLVVELALVLVLVLVSALLSSPIARMQARASIPTKSRRQYCTSVYGTSTAAPLTSLFETIAEEKKEEGKKRKFQEEDGALQHQCFQCRFLRCLHSSPVCSHLNGYVATYILSRLKPDIMCPRERMSVRCIGATGSDMDPPCVQII